MFLAGEIIKNKWSGEAETSEVRLCVEYGNSTWTPRKLKYKKFSIVILVATLTLVFTDLNFGKLVGIPFFFWR